MAEYIEKQAVIKFIDNCLLHEDKLQGVEKETLLAVKNQIEAIPTADVRPVVRGRWIPVTNGRGGHECSRCHQYAPSYQAGNEYLSRFCPFCGCYMGEE